MMHISYTFLTAFCMSFMPVCVPVFVPPPPEVVSLLRELAAGLEEEEDEDSWEADRNADDSSSQSSDVGVAATQAHPDATVQWRRTYLGSAQPPLVVGPLCLKSSAGG